MNEPHAAGRRRVESIDLVRGVIMIVMALDHTRDFFGVQGVSPTDPARAGAALFFTRWITHFCAPVFFLLTGTGAFLALKKKTVRELSAFLLTRGAWLILLELTLVRTFAYQFNIDYQVTMLVVLWALGWSMITLSALVWLPVTAVTAFGLVMIAGHNLLDPIRSANPLWVILHGAPGFVINGPHIVFASYPLVPWIGVTAVGFGLGQLYAWTPDRRRALLLWTGLLCLFNFVVLRGLNINGDPSRWRVLPSTTATILSFLNTTKYPPSLLFLLMTLGPALLCLRAVDRDSPRFLRPALVFGKVPLFYFMLHFFLIHLLAVVVSFAKYREVHWMFESASLAAYPFTPPPGWGFPLPIVYAAWIGVVLTAYPLCRWFAGLKERRRDAWLSYL